MKQSWMVRFRDASSWPTDPKMKFIPCTLTIIAGFGSNEVICLCNYHANELIISILPTPACTILLRSRLISVPRLSVRESPKIIVSHAQKDNRRWDADNQVLYSWQNECSYITSRDLPGEFLSNTVDAVTVISITNSSEVLDTIATVGIGCWGELENSGRSSWSGSEPEAGCRIRDFFHNTRNISSTQFHVAWTFIGGVLIRREVISEPVVVPG